MSQHEAATNLRCPHNRQLTLIATLSLSCRIAEDYMSMSSHRTRRAPLGHILQLHAFHQDRPLSVEFEMYELLAVSGKKQGNGPELRPHSFAHFLNVMSFPLNFWAGRNH